MAMMPTLRRRAVCALALLALLCGLCCCASVGDTAATATATEVTVEVSCSNTGDKLSWRFPGEAAWTPCRSSEMGERNMDCLHLCEDAEEQFEEWRCATACAGANESAAAFTMKYVFLKPESEYCRELPTPIATETALSETPEICQPPSAEPVLPEVAADGKTLRGDGAPPPAAPAAGTPAAEGAGSAEHRADAAARVGSPDSSSPPPTDAAPEGGSGGPAAPRDWTTFITDAEMMLRKSADGGVVVRGTAAPLLLLLLLLGMWGAGALA
ncbi:uncharacterized protein Tco025E_06907 [Trypanosoma conorhini]|uniref:Mucin-like glycoprotein n=1 Tax=Trypanosoma conorhini TaxID=83891 RepID=A0A3R7NZ76_9TRYP|nr:uncharacterized protein Tco025E_06907 [Trypanosoma conorhini]RNF10075.1 hypothetical protein Tco025E_06907 [Trypanosoma conorhini]